MTKFLTLPAAISVAITVASGPVAAQTAATVVTPAYPAKVYTVIDVMPERINCTQLELSAGIDKDKCAKMELTDVILTLMTD